jgi:hypothetical protein
MTTITVLAMVPNVISLQHSQMITRLYKLGNENAIADMKHKICMGKHTL